MTLDSFDHLNEARTGFYTDSHPPVIPALWSVVDRVIAGPAGMLLLQITTFQLGLYLIFRRTFGRVGAAIAASGVLVFPPVMAPMAVIWKDCLMAGFLALGIGALPSERRWVRVAALLSLMLATAFRYNAFAATLPVVVLVFEWRPGLPRVRRYAIAAGAWLAITMTAFGLNAALTDRKMHFWHSSLAVFDIVGTLAHVDAVPDAELEKLFADTGLRVHGDLHAKLRTAYTPRDFMPIIAKRHALWSLPIMGTTPAPQAQRDAIEVLWWDVVTEHPGAYLQHRFAVLSEVLCLGEVGRPPLAVTPRDVRIPQLAGALGVSTEWSPAQRTATAWLEGIAEHTPLFVPWLYAVLAIVWLLLTRGSRDVFALLASGLLLELTLLFLAPSPDYRYSHWLVICTTIGMVQLTARRLRS
ncbi:MAG TPA: hypothetical protein VM513_10765 [Kofleriaceae bacterium]|jgi:hypothetical protein|nr:hypothetical protein [Kofleriaceae bacterium]